MKKDLTFKIIFEQILTTLFSFVCGWAVTCGLLKLITLCFSLSYSLQKATGIWLIVCLLIYLLNRIKTKN